MFKVLNEGRSSLGMTLISPITSLVQLCNCVWPDGSSHVTQGGQCSFLLCFGLLYVWRRLFGNGTVIWLFALLFVFPAASVLGGVHCWLVEVKVVLFLVGTKQICLCVAMANVNFSVCFI